MRVIFLCLFLAGCGAKSNLVKVRIANAGPGLQMFCLPLPLAQELGFYKEEGLEVDLQALPSVGKSLQALIGGSVDVAGVSYAQTLQVAVDGQRLRSFFIMTRRGSNTILVAPAATERIRRAEDMKGALIGVIGTLMGLLGGVTLAMNIDVVVPAIEKLFGIHFLAKDIYYISELPSKLVVNDVVVIAVVSLVLSLLATLYPSWRASRTNPAEALRYE